MSELPRLGLLLGGTQPPQGMLELSLHAEALGLDEVWVAEDCFFTGGIGAVGAILGATSRVKVGTGIVSAFTRHPAITALDFATLASLFPDRVIAGFGFGLPVWLDQMGVRPHQMQAPLRATVEHLRALLAGEEVTADSPPFRFDRVQLTYPPAHQPPIVLGVAGPRLLELSGRIADGTLLGANSSPAYVRWARERIVAGSEGRPHTVSSLAFFAIDEDRQCAFEAVRPVVAEYLAMGGANPMTDTLGISDEITDILAHGGGRSEIAAECLTDERLRVLAVAGDARDCISSLRALRAAGADSVALMPQPMARAHESVSMLVEAMSAS